MRLSRVKHEFDSRMDRQVPSKALHCESVTPLWAIDIVTLGNRPRASWVRPKPTNYRPVDKLVTVTSPSSWNLRVRAPPGWPVQGKQNDVRNTPRFDRINYPLVLRHGQWVVRRPEVLMLLSVVNLKAICSIDVVVTYDLARVDSRVRVSHIAPGSCRRIRLKTVIKNLQVGKTTKRWLWICIIRIQFRLDTGI